MNRFTLKGFTLIELMIAIAIVGVLASIAVPQYTNYVVRARVSELLQQGDAAKLAVAEAIASNGLTTTSGTTASSVFNALNTSYSVIPTANLSSLTINGDGSITVRGTAATNSTNIKLIPTINSDTSISWTCGPCPNADKQRYLPQTCVSTQGAC